MARTEKYFEIPRGNKDETDNIRQALIEKIKKQEQVSYNKVASQAPVTNPYQASVQRPVSPSAQNMTHQQNQQQQYQQYQQNINQQPQAFRPNQYTSYGAYSSPFAEGRNQYGNNNLVDATHSKEPIKYKPKKRKSAGKTFLILVLMIAIIFGLSWALREFVFQAYEIPSGSMEKTIMTGDMVFAEKLSTRFSTPKAGDIVTFKDPQNEGRILIKRIIATPGQEVDIKDDKLFIDGVEQDEPYTNGLKTTKLNRSSIAYPYVVPEDSV